MLDLPIPVRHRLMSGNNVPRLSLESEIEPSADGSHKPYAQHDVDLAERIAERLVFWYPGHFWAVSVDSRQGIATVSIPILLGGNWKYVIKLSTLFSDPNMLCVRKAGGEILERFKVPRSGLDLGAFLAARQNRIISLRQKPPE